MLFFKKKRKKLSRSESIKAREEREIRRLKEKQERKRAFMARIDSWGYELSK